MRSIPSRFAVSLVLALPAAPAIGAEGPRSAGAMIDLTGAVVVAPEGLGNDLVREAHLGAG